MRELRVVKGRPARDSEGADAGLCGRSAQHKQNLAFCVRLYTWLGGTYCGREFLSVVQWLLSPICDDDCEAPALSL